MNHLQLKRYFVSSNDTLADVIKVINFNAKGVALVVDRNQVLKGLLTDGDIRRLLLKGVKLTDKIKNKFNRNFFFINSNNLYKVDLKKIKKNFIHVPILKKKKIINLLLQDDLSHNKFNNLVFILAGGLGKRMGNLTKKLPKPMLNINGKSILENQIIFFKQQGFSNFIISVNYLANKIIKYFKNGKKLDLNINYLRERNPLGTAGCLSLLKNKKIEEDLIVINGDIYADLNFSKVLEHHKRYKNDLTLCASRKQYQFPYGVINPYQKTLDFIDEKPELNFLVNSGIYIIKPKILKLLKFNKYLDMNNFINFLKKNKKKIGIYLIYERIFDIGNKSQYNRVKDIFNN